MNSSLKNTLLNPKKIYYPFFKYYKDYMENNPTIPPWSVEIHPTAKCNHSCIHCSYKQRNENRCSLSEKSMINLLNSLVDMKVNGVYFSGGGEPCIYPNISSYIDYLVKNDIEVALITNGDMIEKSGIIEIANKLNYIAISIPSCNRETFKKITNVDSVDKVLNIPNKIKSRFKNLNTIIGARVVITNLIYKEIESILYRLQESLFDYVIFKVVRDYENIGLGINSLAVEEIKNVISKLNEKNMIDSNFTNLNEIFDYKEQKLIYNKCYINEMGLIANITPEGDVYPNIVEIGQKDFIIGNINDNNLQEIWNSERHNMVKQLSNKKCLNKECRNCRSISYNNIIGDILCDDVSSLDAFI